MPQPKTLAAIQQEILDLLAQDLLLAMDTLRDYLPAGAARQDELLILRSRLNDIRKTRVYGTSDEEDIARRENQLRRDLLDLVRSLTDADLNPPPAASPAADKPSNLLYRIPRHMPKQQETLCVVRIATDPGVLVEDFRVDEHTEQRRLKKLSKSMLVELTDPSGGKNFSFRPTSRAVQTIDLEGEEFTEWRIFVTPLREGEHVLELKVCVIELVDGEKEVRERVLEEHVSVTADDGAERGLESAAPEKQAGPALAFAWEPAGALPPSPPQPAPRPVEPPAPRPQPSSAMRSAALFLVFLLVGTTAGWALTPEVTRDYWLASWQGTEEAYSRFIAEHDDNPYYCEKAYYKRAMVSDDPATVRSYIDYIQERYKEAPAPEHKKAVWGKLDMLAEKSIDSLRVQPDSARLEDFVRVFPAERYENQLIQAVQEKPSLKARAEQIIESNKLKKNNKQEGGLLNKLKEVGEAVGEAQMPPETAETPDPIAGNNPTQKDGGRQAGLLDGWTNRRAEPDKNEAQPAQNASDSLAEAESGQKLGEKVKEKLEATAEKMRREDKPAGSDLPPAPAAAGERFTDPLLGVFIRVPAGTFTMGCKEGRDKDCGSDEKPAHEVTLSAYYIGETEVTQAQWRAVMGSDPLQLALGCNECPVESVSWNDIQQFLAKLNARSGGAKYRLPTEAEWEYAARGGNRSKDFAYAGSNNIGEVAWYDGNSGDKTHPVKGKKPNGLGLYDMSGNVWEWCADWYGDYSSTTQTDPTGPKSGSYRVLRGGSWYNFPQFCRVAYRNFGAPGLRDNDAGFRLARTK